MYRRTYHFDQLGHGDFELHCHRVRHILYRSDVLIISAEYPPEKTVLCFGARAICTHTHTYLNITHNGHNILIITYLITFHKHSTNIRNHIICNNPVFDL